MKERVSTLEIAILIPVFLLLAIVVASFFGYSVVEADRLNMLEAVTSWGLLFLVLFGGVRGWRSIRLIIVAYIVWKLSSIIYHWVTYGMGPRDVVLRLVSAVLFSCFAVWFFWPRASRKDGTLAKATDQQT